MSKILRVRLLFILTLKISLRFPKGDHADHDHVKPVPFDFSSLHVDLDLDLDRQSLEQYHLRNFPFMMTPISLKSNFVKTLSTTDVNTLRTRAVLRVSCS